MTVITTVVNLIKDFRHGLQTDMCLRQVQGTCVYGRFKAHVSTASPRHMYLWQHIRYSNRNNHPVANQFGVSIPAKAGDIVRMLIVCSSATLCQSPNPNLSGRLTNLLYSRLINRTECCGVDKHRTATRLSPADWVPNAVMADDMWPWTYMQRQYAYRPQGL